MKLFNYLTLVGLCSVAVVLSAQAASASGKGKQSIWAGKCKAQSCTIRGESGKIKIKENGKIDTITVVAEECIKVGAEAPGGVASSSVEGCAGLGQSWSTGKGKSSSLASKHGWGYTYKKGENVQVVTDGSNTNAIWYRPTTTGRPAKDGGW